MHTLVGFLLNMTQFNKPALSIADHIQIFKDRGLTITDEVSASFCIFIITYSFLTSPAIASTSRHTA